MKGSAGKAGNVEFATLRTGGADTLNRQRAAYASGASWWMRSGETPS
jgi:hypothetical protein